MAQERILYGELREQTPDLAESLDRIRDAALEIWAEQRMAKFTAHGKDHIAQVEVNLDALTRPLVEAGEALKPQEIFVLLAACYLHDIGMQLDVPDAREEHAQHSYRLILDSFEDEEGRIRRAGVRIDDPTTREAIALVARGHWTSFALKLPSEDDLGWNRSGRLRLLGLLLATADLLV